MSGRGGLLGGEGGAIFAWQCTAAKPVSWLKLVVLTSWTPEAPKSSPAGLSVHPKIRSGALAMLDRDADGLNYAIYQLLVLFFSSCLRADRPEGGRLLDPNISEKCVSSKRGSLPRRNQEVTKCCLGGSICLNALIFGITSNSPVVRRLFYRVRDLGYRFNILQADFHRSEQSQGSSV
jgi:hypothetical protein